MQRLHGIEGVFMGFGGHTGTAAGSDCHGHFRAVGLEQCYIGKYTDVFAEPYVLDGLGIDLKQILRQLKAAEAFFF